MGDKVAARAAMRAAGVPTVPGHRRRDDASRARARAADEIGYPVLLKAAAGGGGKGMRLVEAPDDLEDAFGAAAAEAEAAFGDATLYVEKVLAPARHVEIQVLCDTHGNVLTLGERECSIQRRHQKLVEETPSPALTPELREEMEAAAERACRAVGYVNAGTFEFLLGPDGSFSFIELNARLQVEHPVTELVHRHRPRPRAAARRGGRAARADRPRAAARARDRDPAERRGSGARLHAVAGDGVALPAGARARRARRHVPRGRRRSCRRTTTRCSRSSIVWDADRPAALARAERALGETRDRGRADDARASRSA